MNINDLVGPVPEGDIHEPVTSPTELPDFRLWLLDQWLPGNIFDRVWRMTRDGGSLSGLKMDARFDARCLEKGELWWVTEDMVDLIDHAAKILPPTTLTDGLLPSDTGLVVFAKPLFGTDAEIPDAVVTTNAMIWGDAHIIEDPNRRYTSISSYSYRGFGVDQRTPESVLAERHRLWSPMGRTDWGWGTDTEKAVDLYSGPEHRARAESMAEDRRWFAAFCLLAGQSNVSEHSEVAMPRPVRRRSERAKMSSTVKLIDVRHRGQPATSSGEGREVNWSHRWIVDGFWRQQPYGPGRQFRRPQYILPYIKGPHDKPLVVKDRVNVVKR